MVGRTLTRSTRLIHAKSKTEKLAQETVIVEYVSAKGERVSKTSTARDVERDIRNLTRVGVKPATVSVAAPIRVAVRLRAPLSKLGVLPENVGARPKSKSRAPKPFVKPAKAATHREMALLPAGIHSERKERLLRQIAQVIEQTPDAELAAIDQGSAAVTVGRLFATKRLENKWDEAIGPFYSTTGLLTWLPELSESDLDLAVQAGEILALDVGSTRLYPTFQFDDSGQPLPSLAQVVDTLRAGLSRTWDQALWLVGPIGDDGETAVELLRQGRRKKVLRVAANDVAGLTA